MLLYEVVFTVKTRCDFGKNFRDLNILQIILMEFWGIVRWDYVIASQLKMIYVLIWKVLGVEWVKVQTFWGEGLKTPNSKILGLPYIY